MAGSVLGRLLYGAGTFGSIAAAGGGPPPGGPPATSAFGPAIFGKLLFGRGLLGLPTLPEPPGPEPEGPPQELRLSWPVLQAADVPLLFTWTVLAAGPADAGLRLRWLVFADHPPLGFSWPVIPGAVLDLFDSKGQGAAAGIPAGVLLPVGRVTKE